MYFDSSAAELKGKMSEKLKYLVEIFILVSKVTWTLWEGYIGKIVSSAKIAICTTKILLSTSSAVAMN